ncbi:sigma-54 dependent transcriptional regulator [bacterium]|nr:sigma-54 dependent transcriptional regulator [bacterium]
MTNRHAYPVILSPQANRAVLRPSDGGMVLESAPRWLLDAARIDQQPPFTIDPNEEREALQVLEGVAGDVIDSGRPVREFLTDIEIPGGDSRDVLIDAEPGEYDGTPYVELKLQDVTEIVRERRRAAAVGAFHGIIGQSLPMLDVFQKIAMYGPTEAPVIITGETGTGKELVARALHDRSPRGDGPFVPVNCCALTPELFESELFGHEKGSFTGAYREHKGRFERADGGTLFLDEIGDMPPITQSKMLRALEEGVIERVGGEREREVDVRVVAATNVALEHAVATGRFRSDLYHRLSVFRIHLPPLRDRKGDLAILADSFLATFNERYRRNVKRFTPEALRLLEQYPWPGNIRELRNVVERLVVETQGEAIGGNAVQRWIDERDFLMPGDWSVETSFAQRAPIIPAQGPRMSWPSLPPPQEAIEYTDFTESRTEEPSELTPENIREAFRAAGGNLTQAARDLGVHKSTLYRNMKQLGISREELEELL